MVFGAFLLALLDERVPDRSSLTAVTGQLRSLEKVTSKGGGLSSLRFSLLTDPRNFSYHSSAGNIDDVWFALNQAGQAEVSVLLDPEGSYSPPTDDRSFFSILEVRVGKESIRLYSQVARSLKTDHFIGGVLGYGSAAIGSILLVAAFLKRRHHA